MYSKNKQILSYVKEAGSCTRADIWELFGISNHKHIDACISDLLTDDLLCCGKKHLHHMDFLTITPKGCERLEAIENEANENAQKEKQQRFENKMSVASLLISLISFIIGLIVEHFTGVITAFFALFH